MYERILVPLDGSELAEAALAYAELIPSREVRLLQVEPDTHGPMLASAPEWEAWRTAREAEAWTYLERAGEPLRRQGRLVEVAFVFGDPADQIIAMAADADLIVTTTHGRGTGGRVVWGSVADRVARHAPTATLVVRGGERGAAGPPVARVVVPLDGSALAESALPTATELAADLGVPIHLMRAVDVGPIRATAEAARLVATASDRSAEALRRQAEEYLTGQVQRLRNRDLSATSEVRTGTPALALLDAVGPTDLVVMTTHGRGGLRRWLLGSVADKLVRAAPAPVLLVRRAGGHATAPAVGPN